jgi:hypothetical protein
LRFNSRLDLAELIAHLHIVLFRRNLGLLPEALSVEPIEFDADCIRLHFVQHGPEVRNFGLPGRLGALQKARKLAPNFSFNANCPTTSAQLHYIVRCRGSG